MYFGTFAVRSDFFQGAVLVVSVMFSVDGEHFRFRNQVESFADTEDGD